MQLGRLVSEASGTQQRPKRLHQAAEVERLFISQKAFTDTGPTDRRRSRSIAFPALGYSREPEKDRICVYR